MTDLKKKIDNFILSSERNDMITGDRYYKGDNVTISLIRKTYWSDKYKKEMDNPYVSNYKSGYGFFHDMVSQKVNTLLNEMPTINTEHKFEKKFLRNLGYALKEAGKKASCQKQAYIYLGYDNKLKVFDTEQCIPIYDETNTYLIEFIRWWDTLDEETNDNVRWVEHYTQEGLSLYKNYELLKTTPYKEKIKYDIDEEIHEPILYDKIPIFILRNNTDNTSDLTFNIRSKIDAIDIIQSGFINNIEDFSDVYWVIKNGSGMNSDEFEDFVLNINKTKKLLISGDQEDSLSATAEQINIPTEARSKVVEMLKAELIQDSGVIDTTSLTGSSLTTTAIKAATMKLRQRVSDFEWMVYVVTCEIIDMYQQYNNTQFDYDIEFTELLIDNDTEILDNAVKIKSDISQRSYYNLLKRANYIDDVDAEIKAYEEERMSMYKLEDDEDENGQGTSTNGQDIN